MRSQGERKTQLSSGCSLKKWMRFRVLVLCTGCEAVHSPGEYRPRESASMPSGATGSAQPHPHNPRIQRENPAAAGSGERFLKGKWRRKCNKYRTLSRVDGFGTGSQQRSAHQRGAETRSLARRDVRPARTIIRSQLANGNEKLLNRVLCGGELHGHH